MNFNFSKMNNQNLSLNSNSNFQLFKNSSLSKSFLIGSLSGACSTILFQPFDLIKTRLQQNSTHRNGMLHVFSNVIKNESVLDLWKGLTPSLLRCTLGVGMYFTTLNLFKNYFNISNNLKASDAIFLGMLSRTVSGITLIPFTVIKTRYESELYTYNSIRNAFKSIYQVEGMKGLSSGLLPTLFRDAPFSGLYLMFYTQSKYYFLPTNETPKHETVTNVLFGLNAGIMASIMTHPFDVLKTKMQLYPKKNFDFRSTSGHVYQSYGIKGFFKGFLPRLLRRSLMTTMTWTFYEGLSKKITSI